MRRGEILLLTPDQVDLSRRTIRLSETKNGSARTVPLSKEAVSVFEAALNNPVRPETTDLIFFGEPGADGVRRAYTTNRVWSMALERAGITDFRFHDLRHEAVSRLVEMEARQGDSGQASEIGRTRPFCRKNGLFLPTIINRCTGQLRLFCSKRRNDCPHI